MAAESGLHPTSLQSLIACWTRGLHARAISRRLSRLPARSPEPAATIAVVAPGNVPVAVWTAIIEALAIGAHVRVRPSGRGPAAVAALIDALVRVAPSWAQRVAVVTGDREDVDAWGALWRGADAGVAFGSDEAIAAISVIARAHGLRGPLRGHGDRLSLAWVSRDDAGRLGAIDLDALLTAALLADGRGCLSLRAVLVDADDARPLAAALAARWSAVAARLPAGRWAAQTEAARQWTLQGWAMRQALGQVALWRLDGGAVAALPADVAIDAATLGPGARILPVIAAPDVDALPDRLAPLRGHLAALATPHAADSRVRRAAHRAGFWRLCRPSALQAGPWHRHDGVPLGAGLGL